jgi:UDP-N-acetylglucosamine kinase
MPIEDYSEADLQEALETEIRYFVWDTSPCNRPVAYLTGGQPGSGKSSFQDFALTEQGGNLIIIETDAFRSHHPNYDTLVQPLFLFL